MFSMEEFFFQVNRLKKSRGLLSNNYLSIQMLTELSKENESQLFFNEKAVASFCRDNGVNRLHFYLASSDDVLALKALIEHASQRPFVVDCVGKQPQIDTLSHLLCAIGFSPYTQMGRWRSGKIQFVSESLMKDEMLQYAKLPETEEILTLLYDTFDPFVSHLPDEQKLRKLISDNLVFRVVLEGKIVAVVCLERVGQKGIYVYQDAVSKEYQTSGIGFLLIQYALYQFRECISFTSWTEDSNKTSNRIHKMLGMSYDGLKDAILIYQ